VQDRESAALPFINETREISTNSFLVSKEDVKNFVKSPLLKKRQGVWFVYEVELDILKRLVPPPLEILLPGIDKEPPPV